MVIKSTDPPLSSHFIFTVLDSTLLLSFTTHYHISEWIFKISYSLYFSLISLIGIHIYMYHKMVNGVLFLL